MNQATQLTVQRSTAMSLMQDPNAMANMDQFANYMASGQLMTPAQFRNRPADCFMIAMQSAQWGMNPLSVATQVYDVQGNLTYGSQLIIAIILQSGMVEPRPYYTPVGDWDKKGRLAGNRFENENGLGVKVGFKFKGDTSVTFGETIFLADQTTRNSPTWKTNPYQQLCYLGAKQWSRLYIPGATMGLYSESESTPVTNQDQPIERDISPVINSSSDNVDFAVTTKDISTETAQDKVEEALGGKGDSIVIVQESSTTRTIESLEPKAGDLDDHGTALDFDIHTGTQLKDGSWRLNKNGKELLKKSEKVVAAGESSQEQQSEAAGDIGPSDDRYVIAIHKDSIGMLGSEALLVESFNEGDNTVIVNGQEFPIEDDENTYLEFCNEDGDFDESGQGQVKENPFAQQ